MSHPKELRKALRNVCQDLLPEMMKTEIYMQLQKENNDRLNHIIKTINEAVERLEQRQKDVQSFLVRQVTSAGGDPIRSPEAQEVKFNTEA